MGGDVRRHDDGSDDDDDDDDGPRDDEHCRLRGLSRRSPGQGRGTQDDV